MKKILLLMVAVLAMQTTFAQVQIGDKIAPANVLLTYYAGGVRIAALDEIVAGHMVITKGFYKKAREVLK